MYRRKFRFSFLLLFIFVKLFAVTVKYHTSADNRHNLAASCLGYPVRRLARSKRRSVAKHLDLYKLSCGQRVVNLLYQRVGHTALTELE